jgi:hypothetical protein
VLESTCPRTGIGGESGLPVGGRRDHAIFVVELPGEFEEGADGLTPDIPLRKSAAWCGRIFLQEGDKAGRIKPLPSLEVAAQQLLLRGGEPGGSHEGPPLGKRLASISRGALSMDAVKPPSSV